MKFNLYKSRIFLKFFIVSLNIICFLNLFSLKAQVNSKFDLTVVSYLLYADGLGRLSINIIDMLKDKLKINFINSRGDASANLLDVPEQVKNIINIKDKTPGRVALYADLIWTTGVTLSDCVPESYIKIAYSMFEATEIPKEWVNILNNKFDAVVVPDSFIEKVYKKCGVDIPIFIVPCAINLGEFLNKPLKKHANKIFTFGFSAGFWPRKNHELLLDAFVKAFGNKKNVRLKIHGRFGEPEIQNNLINKIVKYNTGNIEFLNTCFSKREYIKFMSDLDCYVFLSAGEGFSITPRESMALGIPCILSNNSVHKTICETGFVKSVNAHIKRPIYYDILGGYHGNGFSSSVNSASKALKEVYSNYDYYLKKAHSGRNWVKKYLPERLQKYYLSLVKPKKIILANTNEVRGSYLVTSCPKLYNKYQEIIR